MNFIAKKLGCFSLFLATFVGGTAFAAGQPNPRSAVASNVAPLRAEGRSVNRIDADASGQVSRSAARRQGGVVARSAGINNVSTARSATKPQVAGRVNGGFARAGVIGAIARNAKTNNARSGVRVSDAGMARAATTARATAIFNDISKLGTGYSNCRDAYATCMDQFCANANDTYRRCYCSSRFTGFRDTEDALDQAKVLLQQFEDNNLKAVDKTAAEVNAMYSATVGEKAIKKDVSAAQGILNEIGDLLSGKKKNVNESNANRSMGIIEVDFSTDMDDIWSGGGSSIFDTTTGVDLTSLEGQDLYNASNKQCLQAIASSCENSAVLNMATSAYSIMITQDCNAYEKNVEKKRESVMQTVRQAEKYLREARLEEYRAHNSADVNECIEKVKVAITNDVACGANYKRCLDYSGAYVNLTTGEAIYTPRLFELENLITLDGSDDVLKQNSAFVKFLDSKRQFAASALDSCRDIAENVWTEFKRSALIEISQAQDVLLEETRMSCVSTMAECYDTQSGALKDFDNTTAQSAGAISVYAAKAMCKEKVVACAALYSRGGEGCVFDGNGHLTSDAGACGLTELLNFVDRVDETRVAEGCEDVLNKYLNELCTPVTGDMGYPWNCRSKDMGSAGDPADRSATASLWANLKQAAVDNCSNPTESGAGYDSLPAQTRTQIENQVGDVIEMLKFQLMETCENLDGYWAANDDYVEQPAPKKLAAFYKNVYGGNENNVSYGTCYENSVMLDCLAFNDAGTEDSEAQLARYNREKDECEFTEKWYEQRCNILGEGYYEDGVCYLKPVTTTTGTGSSAVP